MMLSFRTSNCALLALALCAVATGCVKRECTEEEREAAGADSNDDCSVFEPLQTFTSDDAETRSVAWAAGTDLRIRGDIREVEIVEGESDDTISVSYRAQVDLGRSREESVVKKTMSHLSTSLKKDGGAVVVSASRGDSEAALGAAIRVELPPGFDSDLVIDKTTSLGGDVEIRHLGNTRQLLIDMDGFGADLRVTDLSAVRRALINTQGDIELSAFASLDAGAIHSSHGDVQVAFANAPDSHVKVFADFGEVAVKLPADGEFNLRANAERGVSTGNAPESCASNSVPSPRLMKCNGGDPDGLTFDLKASREIFLTFD